MAKAKRKTNTKAKNEEGNKKPKLGERVKSLFISPPKERPYNWLGFTENVYAALYVVILISGIDLLTEIVKTPKADTPWEIGLVRLSITSFVMAIFGAVHLRNIKRAKQDKIEKDGKSK